MRYAILSLFSLFLAGSNPAWGETAAQIAGEPAPPPGVVFEVVTGDLQAWEGLLPELQEDVRLLRARFPTLPIAVVSHGREQFSLTKDNARRFESVQARIHALVAKDNVKVQVCGRNAQLHGIDRAQFPSDIEVVERGPLAVQDFVSRGFRRIIRDESPRL